MNAFSGRFSLHLVWSHSRNFKHTPIANNKSFNFVVDWFSYLTSNSFVSICFSHSSHNTWHDIESSVDVVVSVTHRCFQSKMYIRDMKWNCLTLTLKNRIHFSLVRVYVSKKFVKLWLSHFILYQFI